MYDQEPSAGNVNQKQTSHGLGLCLFVYFIFIIFLLFFFFFNRHGINYLDFCKWLACYAELASMRPRRFRRGIQVLRLCLEALTDALQ